jgi:hypothetical protein
VPAPHNLQLHELLTFYALPDQVIVDWPPIAEPAGSRPADARRREVPVAPPLLQTARGMRQNWITTRTVSA